MTRETSLQAYADLGEFLEPRQLLAWVALQRHGPMTAQELDAAADTQGLWKRLSELRNLGFAVEFGTRECLITGRKAVIWGAVKCRRRIPRTAKRRAS